MNERELTLLRNFSAEDESDISSVVKSLSELTKHQLYAKYGHEGIAEKFSLNENKDYMAEVKKSKLAVLKYCMKVAGINKIDTNADIIRAFENQNFSTVFNSIMVSTIESVVLTAQPAQILNFVTIEDVDVGDSYTWEIESKGLPIARKTSYMSNTEYVSGFEKSPITIVPKPYSVGVAFDYLRILSDSYDIGYTLAKIARSMLMAQLKLIINNVYSTTPLVGTPLYQATFAATTYVQLAEDVSMLNGGSPVTAYGTKVAFNAISALATTNYGFMAQDEYIANGFIGKAYGIRNVIIDQITDLSSSFTTASASSLRFVPNDRILLLSEVPGEKIGKLVRENFVRVKIKEANEGGLYRMEYIYYQSFDCAIATQLHYGIQNVAAAGN